MLKKVLALVIAGAMVIAAIPAIAETNNVQLDANVSVSGLETGDTVNFYQIVKWVDSTGWAWISEDFANAITSAATELDKEAPTLQTITGQSSTPNLPEGQTATNIKGNISIDHAAILARAAEKANLTAHNEAESSGTATYANAPAGLYYAQVVPATADYLYNTIFVGADFTSDDNTNTINAASDKLQPSATETTYNAIAKKEQVTLEKDSKGETDDKKYDHNVGDIIEFEIKSKVPAFGQGYITPSYMITDTVESGLKIVNSSTKANAAKADVEVTVTDVTLADDDWDFTNNGQTMTIELKQSGLDKVRLLGSAKDITVKYYALLESTENLTVTEKTNEANVKFSNKPTSKSSYSKYEDKTRHYTFSIDAGLLGNEGDDYTSDELIKIGLSANGAPMTTTKSYHSGTTWKEYSPLQGAIFALFKQSPADSDIASSAAAKASAKIYTNKEFDGIVTSDPDGRLNIPGLDEGTYYLKEIQAPTGYIKDNRTFTITITASYDEIDGGTYTDSENILVKYGPYKVLKSYNVAVNDGTGTTNSTYTITKSGEVHHHVVKSAATDGNGFAGDTATPISNTRGTELPSTGGIGTTLFYMGGAILVLLAGVLLVSKRRIA